MNKYEKVTHELVQRFYKQIEPFTKQRKGCSADYIIDNKYCLEVKYDFRASSTGNIFVEYATRLNDDVTPSGIALSAQNNYQVLYLLPAGLKTTAYELAASKLLELAETHGTKVETRPRVNGNRENFYGQGYKLKIQYIEEYKIGEINV